MFLAPFALTIFGFSTSSASKERFSRGASAGAASGLPVLAGFFAGFALAAGVAVVSAVGAAAASCFSVGAAAGVSGAFSSPYAFLSLSAFSGFGLAGFLCSAILIKLFLL